APGDPRRGHAAAEGGGVMSPHPSPPEVLPAGSIPAVLPVPTALPAPPPTVLPVHPPPAVLPPERGRGNPALRFFGFVFGWLWRLGAGAVMCFNTYILSYLTSIVAFGWTYRWMQGLVLRGWWKQSPRRREGSFR